MKIRLYLIGMLLLCAAVTAKASNAQVGNVSLTGQNVAQGFTMVEFDLSWDNSWRVSVGPSNWDAVWVFVKYRVNNGEWKHAALNYVDGNNDGHSVPSGYTVKGDNQQATVVNSANGVYFYRSVDGSGKVRLQDVQLRWNYASNGVANSDLVDVKVFAIEMVYVPQGAFELGSPATLDTLEEGKFYTYPNLSSPYTVSSEAAITVGTTNGNLYYNQYGDQNGPIPASYPKGYDAYYCMKYETSQEQWLAFFNLLTPTQQTNLDITTGPGKGSDAEITRNGISWQPGGGDATTTKPFVPINFIFRTEMSAYLDWACLRYMSELEFTKACRGTLPAVTGEFAWGNANIQSSYDYSLLNPGAANEQISNPGGNIGNALHIENYDGANYGPFRCGAFASSANTANREETGGSYYGIMEMSGNLFETFVRLSAPNGRNYTNAHGNGIINSLGYGTVFRWSTLSLGLRGGAFYWARKGSCVANRRFADTFLLDEKVGFRGVRTAP